MNGLPYYKAYPRDFFEGTVGMPFDLKGIYRLLLDLIYMHGGKLADEPRFIAGHLGCSVRAWNQAREKLIAAGKISADLGIISNFRADKELESLRTLQEKQRENASKPRKNKDLPEAVAEPKPSHTEPEPEPVLFGSDEPHRTGAMAEVADDGFEQFWEAYPKCQRKTDKPKARAVFSAIVQGRHKQIDQTDAGRIISGVKAYAKTDPDPSFVPLPTTWLNGARWDQFDANPKRDTGYRPIPDWVEVVR